MSYRQHIERCNEYDLTGFRRFFVAESAVGWVRHSVADRLAEWPVFEVTTDAVSLTPDLNSFDQRSEALAEVTARLAEAGVLGPLRGEAFPVKPAFADAPLLQIDRAAVPLFGVVAYGVHLNGFVGEGEGIQLWIGRRADTVSVEPGKFDNLVAGGQPMGLGYKENLIKEAQEEAGLQADLAAQAFPVSAISYTREIPAGLKPDVLLIYDLSLPPDFVPQNTDGEIAAFQLWPFERVLATIRDGFAFKFNVNLVLIDFALRHGFIGPEQPDYMSLCHGLRQPAL